MWLEFDKGYYFTNRENIINKQKHQIDKNVRRQNHYCSTRLNYANKKIREIWMNVVKTTYNSSEDLINKLQSLKGKTKIKFHKNISNYYDEMNIRNFQFEQDSTAKNAQGISKVYHEVLLLMNFLRTKPQVKNMSLNYYDLYYTVIKNRDVKEAVNDEYQNDYINFFDIVAPNHYIGIKNDNGL